MAIDLEMFLTKLEERLKTIPGLNVSFEPPNAITPPHAWIGMPPIENYHVTMAHAHIQLAPTITLLVSKTQSRDGTLTLARFANPTGPQSIRACIEGDETLGGNIEDCIVDDFRPLGQEEVGAIGYYGGRFNLRVIARGN